MNKELSVSRESSHAMLESVRWRLMGLMLERPRTGWLEEVKALASLTEDHLLRAGADLASDATEGTYLHLFGEGGFASPREVTYRPMGDPGQILGSIAGYYESFAFRPQAEEPIDHIAIEVGFVGYLWLKEAAALGANQQEQADVTSSARRRFIEEHLFILAKPWAERMISTDIAYLAPVARSLLKELGSSFSV